MAHLTESVVEQAELARLEGAGWRIDHGPDISPDMPGADRCDEGEAAPANGRPAD